jgi:hypothetical protein
MNEHPIQKSPEDYNEYALQALDEAIYEMSLRNLRVVLTLGNNWDAYGGAPKYAQWANSRGEGLSEDKEFYDNALCKYWYKQYISKILDRYNGWTGYMYRDDSAIFSYELINEGALLHARLPLLVRIALMPPRPGSSLRMQHGTPATRGARTCMSGTRRWPRTRKSTTGSTFSPRALRCVRPLQASASPWVACSTWARSAPCRGSLGRAPTAFWTRSTSPGAPGQARTRLRTTSYGRSTT